jgi:hypothetical protein
MAETIGKYSNLEQGIHLQPHLDKPLGVLLQVVLECEDLAHRRQVLATHLDNAVVLREICLRNIPGGSNHGVQRPHDHRR